MAVIPASVAQWANALGSAVQWAWLASSAGRGFTSRCQVSACYEIILGQVQRVRLCPLSNVTSHITPGLGASGCGESHRCRKQMARDSGLI